MHDLFSLQIAYKAICESVLCKKDLGQLMHRFCMKKKKKKKFKRQSYRDSYSVCENMMACKDSHLENQYNIQLDSYG